MDTANWRAPSGAEFEWDPAKAKSNLRKHLVPFDFATRVFMDPNRFERPDEGDYGGEERWQVIGRADEFVLLVVCTFSPGRIRIISARKATRYELIAYWNGQVSA